MKAKTMFSIVFISLVFAGFSQKVLKGMDVVRKIQLQKDTNQYLVEPVKIWIAAP